MRQSREVTCSDVVDVFDGAYVSVAFEGKTSPVSAYVAFEVWRLQDYKALGSVRGKSSRIGLSNCSLAGAFVVARK